MDTSELRKEYSQDRLDESTADPDPLSQFAVWFGDALKAGIPEPNAMALATSGDDGQPSVRMVLLKEADERGFVFFTNYESRKGRELALNPNAALLFWWEALERQVRIEGAVTRLAPEESDAYFSSRPIGSRISAAVSEQSREITGREWLEQRRRDFAGRHPDGDFPRPEWWGGYLLQPVRIEFWQGRPDRLHDRILYFLMEGSWNRVRLAP
ncbi:MAG: pyridoxamine 5'-phosphate oxidase [Bacteroidales bacterium]|nr:pyridoxamine 5'-phosphate oxidase [Bacteroidales bacterium]